jgi:signal transduction histidine kinase
MISQLGKIEGSERNKLRYILSGFLIGFSGGAIVLMPILGFKIYPIGNLGICIYVSILAYTILKHQILDIHIVIEKAFSYVFLATFASVIYIGAVFLLHEASSSIDLKTQHRTFFQNMSYGTNYRQNFFSISGLFTGITCSAMAVLVFLKGYKEFINRLWGIFCIAVAIWGFTGYWIALEQNEQQALILWKVSYLGVTLIPPLYYHFVTSFIGLQKRRELVIVYILGIFFFAMGSTPLMTRGVHRLFDQFFYLSPGPLYYPFFAYFFGIVVLTHIYMWQFQKNTDNFKKKIQTILFILASAIGFTGGLHCFLAVFGFEVYPYGNYAVGVYPLIMTYAIVKHELFDIRIIIRKTVFFSLFTVFLSVVSLALVLIIHSFFAQNTFQLSSFFINFIGIIFIALLFKPFELFFQKKIEKYFFKGTVSEIAEQKEILEAELERRERLKSVGILAAGMAHEIKNPLTVINAFTEHLPQKIDDPHFREKFIRVIQQETHRMKSIVEDLLMFSKPKEPIRECFKASKVLDDILLLLNDNCMKHDIKVYTDYSDRDEIFADKSQIKQAFLNIIINAIDAMRETGGALHLLTDQDKNNIIVTIIDSGHGISEVALPHIFDPFYSGKEKGTGLGLAITFSVLQRNDAIINVSSKEGQGTTFQIRFHLAS